MALGGVTFESEDQCWIDLPRSFKQGTLDVTTAVLRRVGQLTASNAADPTPFLT